MKENIRAEIKNDLDGVAARLLDEAKYKGAMLANKEWRTNGCPGLFYEWLKVKIKESNALNEKPAQHPDINFSKTIESDDKDRQLVKAKEQLEEANKLIESHIKGPLSVTGEWFDYQKQYLKPVDPLKEAYDKLVMNFIGRSGPTIDYFIATVKELFPKDNGTKGLDKLIEWMQGRLDLFRSIPGDGLPVCDEHKWIEILMFKAIAIGKDLES